MERHSRQYHNRGTAEAPIWELLPDPECIEIPGCINDQVPIIKNVTIERSNTNTAVEIEFEAEGFVYEAFIGDKTEMSVKYRVHDGEGYYYKQDNTVSLDHNENWQGAWITIADPAVPVVRFIANQLYRIKEGSPVESFVTRYANMNAYLFIDLKVENFCSNYVASPSEQELECSEPAITYGGPEYWKIIDTNNQELCFQVEVEDPSFSYGSPLEGWLLIKNNDPLDQFAYGIYYVTLEEKNNSQIFDPTSVTPLGGNVYQFKYRFPRRLRRKDKSLPDSQFAELVDTGAVSLKFEMTILNNCTRRTYFIAKFTK